MTTAARLSRSERQQQTRQGLVAAARRVFLRRGFHPAGLDEIADEAGYTKGAVYSNFAGKDDLFLAVLEEHLAARAEAYRAIALAQATADEAYRAVGRIMVEAYDLEPGWWRLLSEFGAHAADDPELRVRLSATRERFLDAAAELIESVAAKHGVTFRVPAHEVARASGALMRGMAFEWQVDPSAERREAFEEAHAALMRGLER
jgi:AcrR family transcriptional regulator